MKFIRILTILAVICMVTSCNHVRITPVEQQLLDCGSSAVKSQLGGPEGLLVKVLGILNSGQINWQSELDLLLNTAGAAVVCAVQVAVNDLEASSSTAVDGGTSSPVGAAMVSAVHGNMWLVTDGHYKMVKSHK